MFGFSLTKILFTVLAIAAVWYGFKWFNRMQDQRRQTEAVGASRGKPSPASGGPAKPSVEDMVKCKACGDYVAAGSARNCGRPDCPYPG
ncbi:MAG: hypothetical protein ACPGNT_11865 [Rhodospirillales bacterium]